MIVGTRGSELAKAQTNEFLELYRGRYPEEELKVRIVRTTGDVSRTKAMHEFGGFGAFVKELDDLVLKGEIDVAIHSLKDIPTELSQDLEISAVFSRVGGEDVLVSKWSLEELPYCGLVGTSSMRRRAQILRYRNDLRVEAARGNVTTRIRKWREGRYDALILSKAGVERLRIEVEHQDLDPEVFVPSPGQGVVAAVALADSKTSKRLRALDDEKTRIEVEAERYVLKTLGGGCLVPIAARAWYRDDGLDIIAEILSPDGKKSVTLKRSIPFENLKEGVQAFAKELKTMGGGELIEECLKLLKG